jgi:probable HAF family extracellular repeat protein
METALLWYGGRMLDLVDAAPWQNDAADSHYAQDPRLHGAAPKISLCEACGIDDSGQVVGNALNRGFILTGGKMVDLGTLNGAWGETSKAVAMNASGQVIGLSNTASGGPNGTQPFLYMHASMYDLNDLLEPSTGDWTDLLPAAINDNGQIAGQVTSHKVGILTRAVLLTPVARPKAK